MLSRGAAAVVAFWGKWALWTVQFSQEVALRLCTSPVSLVFLEYSQFVVDVIVESY